LSEALIMSEPNPYEPPRAPAAPLAGDSSPVVLTKEEVTAFVGRKARYYLRHWPAAAESVDDEPGITADGLTGYERAAGFNPAAFFLSGIWIAYRKMYWVAMIFWGFILVESFVEDLVSVEMLGLPETPNGWNLLTGLIFGVVCGTFGNQWYLSHTRRQVARVRSLGLPREEHLHALSRRGGTSIFAPLGFILLALATDYVISIAWERFIGEA
jgi:Protein of unknown function (DUF2628)